MSESKLKDPPDESGLQETPEYKRHKTSPDSDELARFREAWRAEVKYRKQLVQGRGSDSTSKVGEENKRPLQDVLAPSLEGKTPLGYIPIRRSEGPSLDAPWVERTAVLATTKTNFTSTQVSAIEIYGKAVAAEEGGDLDTALQLYRTAFRRYDAVDRLWRTAEAQAMQPQLSSNADTTSKASATGAETILQNMAALSLGFPSHPYYTVSAKSAVIQQAAHTASVTGILEEVLASFPPVLEFQLEELAKSRRVTLNSIPDELLNKMLLYLSPRSIERFALVCRRTRVITLDTVIWKTFAEGIYKPPQIAPDESLATILERYPTLDYRQLYIEQPRVRLDGVYIAVCHYMYNDTIMRRARMLIYSHSSRHGTSDNPWVNMTHLIAYHRYIRFYPNGQVLSLLANEHEDPQHVIATLNLSMRMKGLSIGTWHIAQAPLDDDSNKPHHALVYIDNLKAQEPALAQREAKYHFQMTLSLRSRPLGRWNRLDFVRYASVSLDTGEIIPFPLKQERPFWFSKVRSYGSGQNMDKERIQMSG